MKLKVCPFCGKKPTIVTVILDEDKYYQVEHYCTSFKTHLTSLRCLNKQVAIINWNKIYEREV